jgi:hypothetical protein
VQKSKTATLAADEEIEEAIQDCFPEHPEATTVATVRDLLKEIQASNESHWMEALDGVEQGNHTIVHADEEVIVLADHTGHEWDELLAQTDVDDDDAQEVVKQLHTERAEEYKDDRTLWGSSDPLIVERSDAIRNIHDRRESLPDQL